MNADIDFFNHLLDEGSEEFELIFRGLVLEENEELYDLVKENIPAFYEPLLSTYYNPKLNRVYTLEHILYGYIEDSHYLQNNFIAVCPDQKGIVYIPKIGYFYPKTKEQNYFIKQDQDGAFALYNSDKVRLECPFKSVVFLAGSDIEINFESNAIIDQFFPDPTEEKKINEAAIAYQKDLECALNLIRENFPFYYEWLENAVTNIVLFDSDQRNSFASMFIKGAAFINVRNQKPNEIFFLEEITHQCGHVIFYPMSVDRQKLFSVDCETPMSEFTGIKGDDRDVLNAYYAFFPQLYGDLIFDITLDQNLITNQQLADELMGRFKFRMYKYGLGVDQFENYKTLMSEYGYSMFQRFRNGYLNLMSKRNSDFQKIDVSNQVYVFDIDLYKDTNKSLTQVL